jgi:hypothetical protein
MPRCLPEYHEPDTGLAAGCILCLGPSSAALQNWHQATQTLEIGEKRSSSTIDLDKRVRRTRRLEILEACRL